MLEDGLALSSPSFVHSNLHVMSLIEYLKTGVFFCDQNADMWDIKVRCGVDAALAPGLSAATISQSLESTWDAAKDALPSTRSLSHSSPPGMLLTMFCFLRLRIRS